MIDEHVKVNGANVVVENDAGEVLMVKGSYGYWMLPGGGVERAELPGHAALGEALEEAGLVIERADLRLIAILVQKVVHEKKTLPISGFVCLYHCSNFSGELSTEKTNEIHERRFMPLDEIFNAYEQDPQLMRRPYVKMLAYYEQIKNGLLKPVHEAILADPVPLRPQRYI